MLCPAAPLQVLKHKVPTEAEVVTLVDTQVSKERAALEAAFNTSSLRDTLKPVIFAAAKHIVLTLVGPKAYMCMEMEDILPAQLRMWARGTCQADECIGDGIKHAYEVCEVAGVPWQPAAEEQPAQHSQGQPGQGQGKCLEEEEEEEEDTSLLAQQLDEENAMRIIEARAASSFPASRSHTSTKPTPAGPGATAAPSPSPFSQAAASAAGPAAKPPGEETVIKRLDFSAFASMDPAPSSVPGPTGHPGPAAAMASASGSAVGPPQVACLPITSQGPATAGPSTGFGPFSTVAAAPSGTGRAWPAHPRDLPHVQFGQLGVSSTGVRAIGKPPSSFRAVAAAASGSGTSVHVPTLNLRGRSGSACPQLTTVKPAAKAAVAVPPLSLAGTSTAPQGSAAGLFHHNQALPSAQQVPAATASLPTSTTSSTWGSRPSSVVGTEPGVEAEHMEAEALLSQGMAGPAASAAVGQAAPAAAAGMGVLQEPPATAASGQQADAGAWGGAGGGASSSAAVPTAAASAGTPGMAGPRTAEPAATGKKGPLSAIGRVAGFLFPGLFSQRAKGAESVKEEKPKKAPLVPLPRKLLQPRNGMGWDNASDKDKMEAEIFESFNKLCSLKEEQQPSSTRKKIVVYRHVEQSGHTTPGSVSNVASHIGAMSTSRHTARRPVRGKPGWASGSRQQQGQEEECEDKEAEGDQGAKRARHGRSVLGTPVAGPDGA